MKSTGKRQGSFFFWERTGEERLEKDKGEKELWIVLLAAVSGGDPKGLHSVQIRNSAIQQSTKSYY